MGHEELTPGRLAPESGRDQEPQKALGSKEQMESGRQCGPFIGAQGWQEPSFGDGIVS